MGIIRRCLLPVYMLSGDGATALPGDTRDVMTPTAHWRFPGKQWQVVVVHFIEKWNGERLTREAITPRITTRK